MKVVVCDFKGRAWRVRRFSTWREALEWAYFGTKLKALGKELQEAFG
jgi:hypothetical protein